MKWNWLYTVHLSQLAITARPIILPYTWGYNLSCTVHTDILSKLLQYQKEKVVLFCTILKAFSTILIFSPNGHQKLCLSFTSAKILINSLFFCSYFTNWNRCRKKNCRNKVRLRKGTWLEANCPLNQIVTNSFIHILVG